MSLAPDLTLAERYTLERRIAVGGMGEVWRATDQLLSRTVAVKVLKPEYAADPHFLERFRNEARHTAALSHPGIAGIYDYGEVGDMAFLVMECVPGEPLSAVLAREGRLSTERTLDIVGQAGLALQAAHDAGVVHRDVKPGNLLIRPDGVVKVTDFGIARVVDAAPVTQTGLVIGTAAYLSPEQAAGRPVTPASDIYSLGLVTYECLTGERAFAGDSPVTVAMAQINNPPPPLPKDTPPLVDDFVRRALAKDPQHRQANAGDFGRTALALAATLRTPGGDTKLLTDLTPVISERSTAPPDDDRERRRIRNIFIGVAAAVVVAGFLVLHSCAGGSQRIVMPKLTGQAFSQAASTLHTEGLNATERVVHDPAHRAGMVLAQNIVPGTRIGTGSTVLLTVASGPRLVTVDATSYLGQPAEQVQAALVALGLSVNVVGQATADAQPGTVIAVNPSGSVRERSVVTITVASAPAPRKDRKHGGGGGGHG